MSSDQSFRNVFFQGTDQRAGCVEALGRTEKSAGWKETGFQPSSV